MVNCSRPLDKKLIIGKTGFVVNFMANILAWVLYFVDLAIKTEENLIKLFVIGVIKKNE